MIRIQDLCREVEILKSVKTSVVEKDSASKKLKDVESGAQLAKTTLRGAQPSPREESPLPKPSSEEASCDFTKSSAILPILKLM